MNIKYKFTVFKTNIIVVVKHGIISFFGNQSIIELGSLVPSVTDEVNQVGQCFPCIKVCKRQIVKQVFRDEFK